MIDDETILDLIEQKVRHVEDIAIEVESNKFGEMITAIDQLSSVIKSLPI
ncbi:MAG: hypothetical protein V2I33_16790 [Kangiellaceae bacterium]|jgi:hypothetical protein|nr:hypothetical protein [Kangiellaceae bacterium]